MPHPLRFLVSRGARARLSAWALAFACALALAACQGRPEFRNTDVTGADFAQDFSLTGHDGKPYTLADFRGKAVVIFFGYTQCPDVCPTTLAELAEVMKQLGPDAARVQVLFITVDPERDTQALLAQYGRHRAHRQGLQGLLPEGARLGARHLHRRPHRGQLRLRPAGAAAPVRQARHRSRSDRA